MNPPVAPGPRDDSETEASLRGLPIAGSAWTADEIRRVGYRAVDVIAEYLTSLPAEPVFRPVSREAADAFLNTAPPLEGAAPDAILDEFVRTIAPFPFGNGHPRFYGWVNSPPAMMGIVADALAAAMNPSVAGGNHAAVYLERQVLQWFKALVGFPPDSMGLLVSGGSIAALTGLTVARHVATGRRGWNVRGAGLQGAPARLVVYKSAEGHSCHQKAIELLGIGSAHVHGIPTGSDLRMSAGALDRAIADAGERGHIPVAVIASAGTVNTGAVDPLDEIADVCLERHVWLHIDGAYGGPAILTGRYRSELAALARADSVALDPHKWLYVPVEAGLVLVKDAQAMRDAFSLVPPYVRTEGNAEGVMGPPWLSEYGLQQTRGFRALKVWMSLKHAGLDGYRRALEHDIALAERLAKHVKEAPDLELWEPQGMSIVCFRYAPADLRGNAPALDTINKALLQEVQLGGEAFLSSTVLNDHFWLRACIVNPLARERDIDAIVELVGAAGARHASA